MKMPSHDILLIITFGEQSWIVMNNGSWQLIIDDYNVPDGVTQYTVQLKDISTYDDNIFVYINEGWLKVPNDVVQSVSSNDNPQSPDNFSFKDVQTLSTSSELLNQGDSLFFQTIDRTGKELIAKSGFDTTPSITPDIKNDSTVQSTDDYAAITVAVNETCSDNGEIYDLYGNVDDVEDGNTVYVLVTDTQGNSTSFTTTITEGKWYVYEADLSSLLDGSLTVVANTTDNSGNPATSTTQFIKDTLASITIEVETGVDGVINSSEVSTVTIKGSVVGVENGQTILITVTDESGETLQFTALVNDSVWQVDGANLTTLNDGELSYTASVTDTNCNAAEAHTITGKDTKTSLTIIVDTNAVLTDDVLNAIESTHVKISGTVTNVEDNQIVIITVTDGSTTLTFDTNVTASVWSIDNIDLSSLSDGPLTFTAMVNDIAGNYAVASTVPDKDTLSTISVDIISGGDGFLLANEINPVIINGSVTNVEAGQIVSITLLNENGDTDTLTAVVQSDLSWSTFLDISRYNDGGLIATATVTDVAGNLATTNNSAMIDTSDGISLYVNTFEDTFDFIINSAEADHVNIVGLIRNVEDGQVITVTVSDGVSTKTFTTDVNGLTWSIPDADLSTLNDGALTFTAQVSDIAGNITSDTKIQQKDTQASITVVIDSGTDNFLLADELNPVTVYGVVDNIEPGQIITLVLSDTSGNSQTLLTTVPPDLTWTVSIDLSQFSDGGLTAEVSTNDLAGNLAAATDIAMIDRTDGIAIFINTFEDTIDTVINAAEAGQVDIVGLIRKVEDGQTITVTVSDDNQSITFTTTVNGFTWSIPNADLTTLNDGPLTFTSTVSDIAGNITSASKVKVKDTQAEITINVDTDDDTADSTINANEATQVDISGTVNNIEDNQTVTLRVNDGISTLIFNTTVINGNWLVNDADLSSLHDGTLTYTAQVTDVAGNSDTASVTTLKDTQATIALIIDSGVDNFLLAHEINPLEIYGTVVNVEAGQLVTVILTNNSGDTDTISAIVNSDLTWSTSIDISTYNDGELTAVASVSDLAGNPTNTSDTATIDTQIAIDIDTGTHGLDITEFRANNISQFEGTTNAEIGQSVTLTITDGRFSNSFIGIVDSQNHWVVNDIDISGLNSKTPWKVSASVNDLAGNIAVDDMPIIDTIRTNVLSEIIVAILGSQSDSQILDINNTAVTNDSVIKLSDSQAELDKITSEGSSITVSVADDGQSLTLIRDNDGELVMKMQLILASVKVTLYEAVDNPDSFNGILKTFATIIAVQTDEDGTTETITLPTRIEIYDSPPLAINDNYSVIEDETAVGSLTGNDYTAEGPLKVTSVTIEDTEYVIPNNHQTTINLTYGDLTIDTFGSWTFIASDNLNNSLLQEFNLTYEVIDDDGSLSTANATFTIQDGKAGIMNDTSFTTSEPDLDTVNTDTFTFSLIAGSDTLLPDTITFDNNTIDKLSALALTSNGQLITYNFSNSDSAIIATAHGNEVFVLTLDAVNNGDDLDGVLSYQQKSPIDHNLHDDFTLPLTVTAQDLDGTAIESGKILLTIDDGNNPQFSSISESTLNETALIGGAQTSTGVMSTLIGSDEITRVIFNNSAKQPDLTADGEPILYNITNGGTTLTAYTNDINNPIFKAELSDNFNATTNTLDESYTFTLYQTLDQNITDKILLSIKVSDSDGDNTNGHITINVIDDASAQISPPDLLVSEIPVDFSGATNIATGDVIITSGTDKLIDLDYAVDNGTPVLDSNGNALTQNGKTINWLNLDNGTLQGKLDNGTVIFTVKVPDILDQGSLSTTVAFALLGPIDHLSNQSDSLTILVPMVIIDQDGTRIVENMNVQIDDGLNPVILNPVTANVVDEGLLINNNNVSVVGSYDINSGSDSVIQVVIAEGYNFTGVTTRGGINVSLATSANNDGWFIATDDGNNNEVFRIRFNTDNTYEYQQSQALDHPLADGINQLTLNFDIQAIDADGDRSIAQALTVDIKDDIPEATITTVEFAEGDEITLQLLSDENSGADGATITKITYNSVDYIAGDTITLIDDEDAEVYGTLIIDANGNATINSVRFDYPSDVFNDSLTFETTDADGDSVTNTLNLIVNDGAGAIIARDYATDEDTPVTISIIANPGDTDAGEVVTEIRINILSLNGGTLTLDGMTIPDDGTDYVLSGGLISITAGTNTARPNGDLVFTPAMNTSDAIVSQKVSLDISVQIEEAGGIKKPLIFSTVDIAINSVADLPVWDDALSTYVYNSGHDGSIIEDGTPVSLVLKADLTDTDTSELLTFRIEDIDEDLRLTYNDGAIKAVTEGSILTQAQLDTLSFSTVLNSSGEMTFKIIAIATEQDNGDLIELPEKTISIHVQAVADKPDVTVKNIRSNEDVAINVNDIISGQLTDVDGSETLSFELTLPSGWTLNGINGAIVSDLGSNVWSVLASDVTANNIELMPLSDISSVENTFTIDVQSVSTDSETDNVPVSGVANTSEIKTLTVILKGVIDPPTLANSTNWGFDDNTLTITNSNSNNLNEDNLVPLDFQIVTTDNDSSEVISLTITGFPEGV